MARISYQKILEKKKIINNKKKDIILKQLYKIKITTIKRILKRQLNRNNIPTELEHLEVNYYFVINITYII
jgi:hypothetical protein